MIKTHRSHILVNIESYFKERCGNKYLFMLTLEKRFDDRYFVCDDRYGKEGNGVIEILSSYVSSHTKARVRELITEIVIINIIYQLLSIKSQKFLK